MSSITFSQSVKWLNSAGGVFGPQIRDLAVDKHGNIYAVGASNNTNMVVNGATITSRGSFDGFLTKYSPAGQLIWIKTIGGSSADVALQVETDDQDRVYVSVFTQSSPLHIADSVLPSPVSGILRFDSSGRFDSVLASGITAYNMKVFQNSIYIRTSGGAGNLRKLNLNGATVWSKSIVGSFTSNNPFITTPETSLEITPHGNLIFSQSCVGPYTYEGVTVSSSSGTFVIATLIDSNSNFIRNYALGMNQGSSLRARSAIVDANHNVYLAASFPSSFTSTFGSSNILHLQSGSSFHALLKFDSLAAPVWAFNITCANSTGNFYDLSTDNAGNIAMLGMYTDITSLGSFSFPTNSFNGNIFTATINPSGTLLTAMGFGSFTSTDRANDLQLLADGSFVMGGMTNNAAPVSYGCISSVTAGFMVMKYSYDTPLLPDVSFTALREQRNVFFTSSVTNTTSLTWDFGDGTTSTQRNPTHTYNTAGNFEVRLVGSNSCGTDTFKTNIIYKGIQKVLPEKIGNNKLQMVFVKGGFPFDTAIVFLKQGTYMLQSVSVAVNDSGIVQGNFSFKNEPLGFYDVIIKSGSFTDTLKNGIEVEAEKDPGLTIQVDGPQLRLVNRFQRYRVTVSNPGNINHFGVPVIIAMHPDNEIAKLSNRVLTDSIGNLVRDSAFINDFIKINDPQTNDSIWIGYFVIPVVTAQSSESIEFFMRGKTLGDKPIFAILMKPLYDSLQLVQLGLMRTESSCDFYADPVVCILDLADQVPGFNCITSALSLGCAIGNLGRDAVGNRNKKGDVSKYMSDIFNLLSDIIGVFTCTGGPLGQGPKKYAKEVAEDLLVNVMGKVFGISGALASGDVPNIPLTALGLPVDLPGACVQAYTKRNERKDISDWIVKDVSSMDPNDKAGPFGFTADNFIDGKGLMHYTIRFENINTATAPASEVRIFDTLDAGFYDINSIRFTGFGFSDSTYQILFAQGSYVQEVDLRPGKNTIVRFKAFLDSVQNVLKWTFESLDPVTREPVVNVQDGFLNPNQTSPEGEGFVSFSIMPLPNRPHLQQVLNRAEIIFDENASIFTDYWVNTIDIVNPGSQVLPLPTVINDTLFTVKWQGTDVHSGIKNYDVFVVVNDTLTYKLLSNTRADSIKVKGKMGSTYKFFSVAVDRVGNLETPPVNPDAVITLSAPLPLDLIDFTARANQGLKMSELNWKTANEQDVSHFEIQRRDATGKFITIGKVPALNDPGGALYNWNDESPIPGRNQYRLKMVDLNGQFKYSQERTVRFEITGTILVYPTVTSGTVFIKGDKMLEAELFSAEGVKHAEFIIRSNGEINISHLPAGIYFLKLRPSDKVIKIIKQ